MRAEGGHPRRGSPPPGTPAPLSWRIGSGATDETFMHRNQGPCSGTEHGSVMARIRSIKPEFPQSESMGNVSRDARLAFIEMWTLADDSGRLRGNSRMLASLLFPYDDDAPILIDGWLGELEREGCIVRYRHECANYIEVCNWTVHQKIDKPSQSKIPSYSECCAALAKAREDSRGFGEASKTLPVGRDQGRDQGEEGKPPLSPPVDEPPSATDEHDASPDGSAERDESDPTPAEPKSKAKSCGTDSSRGSRLPADWALPKPWGEWATAETGWADEEIRREADRFRDFWVAQGGQKGRKADWLATWRNWVRKAVDDRAVRDRRGAGNRPQQNRQEALEQRNREVASKWVPPEVRGATPANDSDIWGEVSA